MSGPFVYELASVHAAVARATPGSAKGIYALPFYLVVGDPGAGRTTALRAMNLSWSSGEGPLQTGVPQPLSTYWMAKEAVFLEPEANVLGTRRDPELLRALCDELRSTRAREPIDGVVLVLSVADFIDLDEAGLEAYAQRMRLYLTEVGRALHADVPVYVIVTRFDTLAGFAEVFQWTAERTREDPWGFTLPNDTPSQQSGPMIQQQLDALGARFEAYCIARLSSEDPPERRTRAFQHLAEVRAAITKLRAIFQLVAMVSSFERAPWIRSMTIGCAVPGIGDRLRVGVQRFTNMGLAHAGPPAAGTVRPGGLPFLSFMKDVVLPERELVPLRVRWRDDRFLLIAAAVGLLFAVAAGVLALVL